MSLRKLLKSGMNTRQGLEGFGRRAQGPQGLNINYYY